METSNIAVSSGNVTQLVTTKDNSGIAAKQQAALDLNLQKIKEEKAVKSEQDEKRVGKAVSEMNSFFQNENRKLSFSVNKEANMVVIEVKDSETDKTIRQIPSEVVVRLAEHLNDLPGETSGMLLAENA